MRQMGRIDRLSEALLNRADDKLRKVMQPCIAGAEADPGMR